MRRSGCDIEGDELRMDKKCCRHVWKNELKDLESGGDTRCVVQLQVCDIHALCHFARNLGRICLKICVTRRIWKIQVL